MDLALNNLQWLVCHKTKSNQTKTKQNKKYHNYEYEKFVSSGVHKHQTEKLIDITKWKVN